VRKVQSAAMRVLTSSAGGVRFRFGFLSDREEFCHGSQEAEAQVSLMLDLQAP
jgi:hypothetical protein